MGNGNNRNRRGGARTRHGPHRGGAGNSANRSATHLMPPALRATEVAEAPNEEATLGEEAPANSTQPAAEELDAPTAAASESAPVASEEPPSEPAHGEPEQPAAEVSDEQTEPALEPEPPEPERPAPRGRFERFYAPGQGMRVDRNGGKSASEPSAAKSASTPSEANGANGATGSNGADQPRPSREANPSAPAHPAQPAAPAAHLNETEEDGVSAQATPREDVRGAVGGLIDTLHDLFAHDRSIASQGGISRCGICYLHYPANELTYREAEGFYVCESCGHALGAGRVMMVRRQQRL